MTEDEAKYCRAVNFMCPCGRAWGRILDCNKPFSPQRMAEIFGEMHNKHPLDDPHATMLHSAPPVE